MDYIKKGPVPGREGESSWFTELWCGKLLGRLGVLALTWNPCLGSTGLTTWPHFRFRRGTLILSMIV